MSCFYFSQQLYHVTYTYYINPKNILMPSKAIQGLVGVTMFLFLSNNLSRKAGPSSSLWARAFSTTNGSFQQRNGYNTRTSPSGSEMSSFLLEDTRNNRGKCYSTTTSLYSGVVEQDLDSALDDLLQGTFDELEEMDSEDTEDDSASILSTTAAVAEVVEEDVSFIWE